MTPFRVYTDTSVIGGCFDEEFAEHSNRLIENVRKGRFKLLVSEVVAREVGTAPPQVRQILANLGPEQTETVPLDERTFELVAAYMQSGVVEPSSIDDATHVAAATVVQADAIVSWNFKHIVRLDKIKAYNRVNEQMGYEPLTILSPVEVNYDDTD